MWWYKTIYYCRRVSEVKLNLSSASGQKNKDHLWYLKYNSQANCSTNGHLSVKQVASPIVKSRKSFLSLISSTTNYTRCKKVLEIMSNFSFLWKWNLLWHTCQWTLLQANFSYVALCCAEDRRCLLLSWWLQFWQ